MKTAFVVAVLAAIGLLFAGAVAAHSDDSFAPDSWMNPAMYMMLGMHEQQEMLGMHEQQEMHETQTMPGCH